MANLVCLEEPHWFVLNHIGIAFQDMAKRAVDRFNSQHMCALELFSPTYVVREEKNGEIKMRAANLTYHYVFVRGNFSDVKLLCSQNNGFSFLINHSSTERYAIVSDRDMVNFKNIARAYENSLPYFSLDEIDLEDGDLVEVVNGNFPGLVGIYMPKPKSNSGNIVLNVYKDLTTIVFNVKATDVRVLEFSKKSTRANDQIDAILPYLLKALRLYKESDALPRALIAKMSVFCSRMGVVRLNNCKLDAKLQSLLYGCNSILGNMREALIARAKYENQRHAVTNEWTLALIALIFAVIENDDDMIKNEWTHVKQMSPKSKAQVMIVEEYAYYNR